MEPARMASPRQRRVALPADWPPSLGRALFALFIAGVLGYGAAYAWYVLARFDVVNLLRDASVDDAFYYFQIAYHMAEGRFSTFDGGITRTNGYHPLWLFLITPFYWLFDKTEALFAVKAFEVMLLAGGVALVALATRVARLPWILLFAALPALIAQPGLLHGMEAALGLFTLALLLLIVCLFARDPARWRWALAATVFALPWVRLEYAAIAFAVPAALYLLEWRFSGASATGCASRSASARPWRSNAFPPLAGACVGIVVYLAYNGIVFGGVVPVSGAVKAFWSQRLWDQEGGYDLVENARAFLQSGLFDYELWIALEVGLYVALVGRFARTPDDRLLLAFLTGVLAVAVGHAAKFAQSVLAVHPRVGLFEWYFVPAFLAEALIVPVRCCVVVFFVRRFAPPRREAALRLGVVAATCILLFAKTDFRAPFQAIDEKRLEVDFRGFVLSNYMGVTLMDLLLPKNSVVGSWSAGVVGYFSRLPVVNLDGLAGPWEHLRSRPLRNWDAFVGQLGITHFADIRGDEDAVVFEGPWLYEEDTNEQFTIWTNGQAHSHTRGMDPSAWFWTRMRPHLETQVDGSGLLVDGRLAQAFRRDCGSDDVAAWTWEGDGRAEVPWMQTSVGFCVSALILPHDARSPVQVSTRKAARTVEEPPRLPLRRAP